MRIDLSKQRILSGLLIIGASLNLISVGAEKTESGFSGWVVVAAGIMAIVGALKIISQGAPVKAISFTGITILLVGSLLLFNTDRSGTAFSIMALGFLVSLSPHLENRIAQGKNALILVVAGAFLVSLIATLGLSASEAGEWAIPHSEMGHH